MADQRIAHLNEEKKEWLRFTNFNIWSVLKLVSGGKKHIREMVLFFKGSSSTLEITVNDLIKWGLLSENREQKWPFKRTLSLTKSGMKMLGLLDEIGNMVEEIRRREKGRRGGDE